MLCVSSHLNARETSSLGPNSLHSSNILNNFVSSSPCGFKWLMELGQKHLSGFPFDQRVIPITRTQSGCQVQQLIVEVVAQLTHTSLCPTLRGRHQTERSVTKESLSQSAHHIFSSYLLYTVLFSAEKHRYTFAPNCGED